MCVSWWIYHMYILTIGGKVVIFQFWLTSEDSGRSKRASVLPPQLPGWVSKTFSFNFCHPMFFGRNPSLKLSENQRVLWVLYWVLWSSNSLRAGWELATTYGFTNGVWLNLITAITPFIDPSRQISAWFRQKCWTFDVLHLSSALSSQIDKVGSDGK